MRHRTLVVLALLSACARSFEGPAPAVTAVSPEVVCAEQLDTPLAIAGARFSPHPTGLLQGEPGRGVALPEVLLVGVGGESALPGVAFESTASLTATFPRERFAPGTYGMAVRNPNGFSGSLPGALTVVPPPQVLSVAPPSASNAGATTLLISGAAFRASGAGEPPSASLTPSAGGIAVELRDEALEDASTLSAVVPPGLTPGSYDLTVRNPEGCAATLREAFVVLEPPTIDLVAVTPAFGWSGSRTTLQITASNAQGRGLAPVPEVFLLVDPERDGVDVGEVPLIREAYLSRGSAQAPFDKPSVVSAVVPASTESRGQGVVVGGPYDLKVVNPDGAIGYVRGAFTVLADPPPVIERISPEQAARGSLVTLTVSGADFKDPSAALSPRLARVLLLTANLAPRAACAAPQCHECASPQRTTAGGVTTVTCNPPLAAMASGAYVVRVEHLDDGSFGDHASFAVTNPAGNLASATAPLPRLNTARMAHGAAFARDDLGNRFVYVAGGRSGAGAESRLDAVEVMPLPMFSAPSAWTELPVRLPGARDGLALVASGSYLFAIGGRDATDAVRAEVYRARVLGADTAPVIGEPVAEAGGSLAAGTYYYKVSAVMDEGTDNAGGETLASDGESIRVGGASAVRLTWQPVPGAASYRVYRSSAPDQLAGTEGLLATSLESSYLDTGAHTVDEGKVPLPVGATGVWMPMSPLPSGRADAAATIARFSGDDTQYLFVLGGRSGSGVESSVYSARIDASGGTPELAPFQLAGAMPVKRAELGAVTASASTAPALAGKTGKQFLVVTNGLTEGGASNNQIHRAEVDSGGLLAGGWSEAAAAAQYRRHGHVSVLTSNFLFTVGGRDNTVLTKGQTAVTSCPGPTCEPPALSIQGGDSGITLSTGRYRASLVYESAYFYFVGGSADGSTALATAERGGYAN